MTYKEIIYMVMDELKLSSRDSFFNEDHVKFLLIKFRSLLTRQRYNDIRKQVPLDFYQYIPITLTQVPAISGEPCEGGVYLKSTVKIPHIIEVGKLRVYPTDYFQGEFNFVTRERLRYIGEDNYARNMVYCAIGPDQYLYFKSSNPQFLNLKSIKVQAVFDDTEEAFALYDTVTNILDAIFPVDNTMVPTLLDITVKELQAPVYAPRDDTNNANDNLDDSVPNQSYINAMKQQGKSNSSEDE